ncbi:MAG: MgtC/SapB family protein [Deltaproteobacteria bacterium]|nr:MgtC/SapB family protein [Deltaproteobacteria bacterium]
MDTDIWLRFGVSLSIGILVGMQRERQNEIIAGIRTFALTALVGTLTGYLAKDHGGLALVAGALSVTITVAVGGYLAQEEMKKSGVSGVTTEIAMLTVFMLGAWLASGPLMPAVVVGATVFVLLYAKPQLHGWTRALQDRDWHVIARFILVSCVILPVLPDRTFGPFDVLNPRETWLMVVLIVGLGLVGFVVQKLFGEKTGIVATGLLGGIISSTATTVTYARAAKERGAGYASATLVIMLASTVVYVRLLIEAGVAAPGFSELRVPLLAMGALSLLLCVVAFFLGRRDVHEKHDAENPSQFRTAFVFAGLYALISLASAAANHHLGDAGLYVVAAISGLTDLDAITLSTARLVHGGKLDEVDGWRVIVVAIMSNLLFKSGLVWSLGSMKLFRRAGVMLIGSAVFGLVLVLVLPALK